MKYAGHTMGTPEYSLEGAIELLARLGFDGIEIIWDDLYGCALRRAASPKELAELRRRLDGAGLAAACLTPYMMNLASLDERERRADLDAYDGCLAAAQALGCRLVRAYGGSYVPARHAVVRPEMEQRLVDSLSVLADKAAVAGAAVAVETHFNTVTSLARETAGIIRRVGRPEIGVLYDQPNIAIVAGEDAATSLSLLEGLIAHVHVKDLVFREGVTVGFEASTTAYVGPDERRTRSRIPGQGIVEWPLIMRTLVRQGYDGWLSLEYERRWYPDDLPPAEIGMKQGMEYMRSLRV